MQLSLLSHSFNAPLNPVFTICMVLRQTEFAVGKEFAPQCNMIGRQMIVHITEVELYYVMIFGMQQSVLIPD